MVVSSRTTRAQTPDYWSSYRPSRAVRWPLFRALLCTHHTVEHLSVAEEDEIVDRHPIGLTVLELLEKQFLAFDQKHVGLFHLVAWVDEYGTNKMRAVGLVSDTKGTDDG